MPIVAGIHDVGVVDSVAHPQKAVIKLFAVDLAELSKDPNAFVRSRILVLRPPVESGAQDGEQRVGQFDPVDRSLGLGVLRRLLGEAPRRLDGMQIAIAFENGEQLFRQFARNLQDSCCRRRPCWPPKAEE